jgi:hypothetical protein
MKQLIAFLIGICVVANVLAQDPKTAKKGVTYGAKTNAKGAITAEELTQKLGIDSSFAGKVSGTVTAVCQAKGCWMRMKTASGQEIMIKFKDYAFFMPKDLAGTNVVIDGVASVKTVSVATLKHYAEDAGKSEAEINAITEPKKEIMFMAKGVLVL